MSCLELISPLSVCYLAVLTLLHFFLTLPQEYMKLDLQLPSHLFPLIKPFGKHVSSQTQLNEILCIFSSEFAVCLLWISLHLFCGLCLSRNFPFTFLLYSKETWRHLHVLPLEQRGSDSSSLVFVFSMLPPILQCPVLFLYFFSDFLSTILNLSPSPTTLENKAHFHFTPVSYYLLSETTCKNHWEFFASSKNLK